MGGRETGDTAIEVHVTTPDAATAARLARVLVEDRLAACVQVVPGVRSHYRWEGEVVVDDEHLLLVKSVDSLFGPLAARIRREHPYDTPEVLAVPAVDVDERYFCWLRESVHPEGPDAAATPTEDPP